MQLRRIYDIIVDMNQDILIKGGIAVAGLYESGENYLETILMLQKKGVSVRSIDIATEL